MFVFIIPLKSQTVSKDWNKTCWLFERTLRSVCNQTSTQFSVLVVCHEKPGIDFVSPQVQYVQVNFPPPNKDNTTDDKWYFKGDIDKNRKTLMGLYFARNLLPNYVMVVDADDCVSNKLVKYAEKHPASNGWFFNQGYFYNQIYETLIFKYRKFNLMCGTSNIINYNLINLPANPEYNRGYGYYRDHVIFLKHDHAKDVMAKQGNPLRPLPFPGAIYIIDNGENIYFRSDRSIYGSRLENLLGRRSITPQIREQFYLYSRS